MQALRAQRWRYSLKCLAALVVVTAAVLFAVDRVVLASIAADGSASGVQLNSPQWQQENERINQNNKAKILSSPDEWIWQSLGFPVSAERTRPHRILVTGDSFVWGDGYSNMNDIWWRQLVIGYFVRNGHFMLLPVVVFLLVAGLVLYFVKSSALAPFIYTLF